MVSGLVVFCQQFRNESGILLSFYLVCVSLSQEVDGFPLYGGETLINKFFYMSTVGVKREGKMMSLLLDHSSPQHHRNTPGSLVSLWCLWWSLWYLQLSLEVWIASFKGDVG